MAYLHKLKAIKIKMYETDRGSGFGRNYNYNKHPYYLMIVQFILKSKLLGI